MDDLSDWPAHGAETVPWQNRSGRGPREDRVLREVTPSIPPFIADRTFRASAEIQSRQEAASLALAGLEADAGPGSVAVSTFLLRTESIASSKIEQVEASVEDFARAIAGIRSNESATSMVAASSGYTRVIDDAGRTGAISLESLLAAHRTLMADDPMEASYAGRVRDMQNWIGGNDFSPIGAVHISPDPHRVGALIEDLLVFVNRDDVPVLSQAAVAHAQFESIHPFTDGNGRIGRALIGAILRRRGFTRNTTPPIAAALAADIDAYFDTLTRYRAGDPEPIVRSLAVATRVSSEEAAESVRAIRALPREWAEAVDARANSATALLLGLLLEHPVISAEEAEDLTGASTSSIYTALDRLETAGILRQITKRQRNRVWAVAAILDELSALDMRVARRVRDRDR
ncbi:DNA-binding protein [Subtercola boreus]|uniref:DNA-binding protein n=1 Tax=Subtercola boreus TaxID=120213 RepID=A0A3E0W8R5_9MICO|nr:DNA-binding protein [Subtercola boreus]RFA18599.1 DNA-binding protein [Subtercola boreus]RFA25119.1 DNA-binding protein [Subtercola boreus]